MTKASNATISRHLNVDSNLIEAVRAKAAELEQLVLTVESHIRDQHVHAEGMRDLTEQERLDTARPFRWLDDARHNLQAGVMFLERAIHQPTTF